MVAVTTAREAADLWRQAVSGCGELGDCAAHAVDLLATCLRAVGEDAAVRAARHEARVLRREVARLRRIARRRRRIRMQR